MTTDRLKERIEALAKKMMANAQPELPWDKVWAVTRKLWMESAEIAIHELTEEWKPIETAPLDRLITLWNGNNAVVACYWDRICKEWRTSRPSGHPFSFRYATHWREEANPPPP